MKAAFLIFLNIVSFWVLAQKPKLPKPVLPVEIGDGQFVYNADSITGDRVPDYSFAGYKASEQEIPMVPVRLVLPLIDGDATATIQKAITELAKLPLDKNGFRGAVLLSQGTYEVQGQIRITASGIVLRGFGAQGQTILKGMGVDRDGLIRVFGKDNKVLENEMPITNKYVPVNGNQLTVSDPTGFKVGDRVIIKRPSTKEWIETLGTETFGGGVSALGWKPGDVDLYFDRTITAVSGNSITVDVPLTTSLDEKYGGGTIAKYNGLGRIQNIGIENITLISDYDASNPKDENHRWMAITLDNVEDAWVRQVSFKHFAGSAVYINAGAKRITVEDCISSHPVSEIGGQRRNTFFTRGQQTLFQRCFASGGYHDFSVGHAAAGPNAFVQCTSERPYNFSGTTGAWASGVLFDIVSVDGNAIRFGNREQDGRGAGWSGANCFLWNCSASLIECDKPPTAQNWSYGSWSEFAGKGFWAESNNHLTPRSFFYTQIRQRLNKEVSNQAAILDIGSEASSSPSVEVAQQLTKEAWQPKTQMDEWIALAAQRNPISTTTENAKIAKQLLIEKKIPSSESLANKLIIENGWLVENGKVVFGRTQEVPWWTGGVEARTLQQAKQKLSITRFVPGRVGAGLTDDLEAVVDSMKANNMVALNQHYGLWYERRRDDHERIRRMSSEVWPPFYELPFARSGKDSAWDGLSKYDLTKYNQWYWKRMQQFANLADQNGLVMLHQNYFQHNIIEAGAHYADFPWRTANNINNTGFVEPVNYAGEKRIFYADQFYDTTNFARKEIHKKYIQQCFNSLAENSNVIQFISEEFTGPLPFVAFWLDCIKSIPNIKSNQNKIGLSTTKDVQDAILSNPKYAPMIDVIDIKYWHYKPDGTVYAPEGGKNLAPRQWARLLKPKTASFEQVHRAVKEYRTKYPEKAVLFSADGYDRFGWAVFMAGGSLPVLPKETSSEFLKAAATMAPTDKYGKYALAGTNGLIVYTETNDVTLDLSAFKGSLKVKFIDPQTGMVQPKVQKVAAGKKVQIEVPQKGTVLWIGR